MINKFHFWCQKVLPLVYDNSLSYYEVICKLTTKLNEIIENVNELPEYIQQTIKEYITSGDIEKVLNDIISNFLLNVKNPPVNVSPAVGDGTTDDTNAFNQIISYAHQNGGGAIFIPNGNYLIGSLTLYDNVSLVGNDRYSTKLVLKSGATNALINGSINGVYISNITLDANSGNQVKDIDVINISGSDILISQAIITDGFNGIVAELSGHTQINDVIFDSAIKCALQLSGTVYAQINNCIFNTLSELNGEEFINLSVSESSIENTVITGAGKIGIACSGVNNYLHYKCLQCVTPFSGDNTKNTVIIDDIQKSQNFSGKYEITAQEITNNNVTIYPNEPLKYGYPISFDVQNRPYAVFKDSTGTTRSIPLFLQTIPQPTFIGENRPKIQWQSANVTRVNATQFSNRGFRFFGKFKKAGTKVYTVQQAQNNGAYSRVSANNDTAISSGKTTDCWNALFAVPINATECKLVAVPVFNILAVTGNVLTLGTTSEVSLTTPYTGTLNGIENMDVLLINSSTNTLSGSIRQAISADGNELTIDNAQSIGVNSAIVIAPASEYEYVGCHYIDTAEWRNRSDDGFNVFTYGGVPPLTTGATSGAPFVLNYGWTISPFAGGVWTTPYLAVSGTAIGQIIINTGEDTSHLIPKCSIIKTEQASGGTTEASIYSPFGQRREIAYSITNLINGEINQSLIRPWGYTEY